MILQEISLQRSKPDVTVATPDGQELGFVLKPEHRGQGWEAWANLEATPAPSSSPSRGSATPWPSSPPKGWQHDHPSYPHRPHLPDCDSERRIHETTARFIAGSPYPAERYRECERCKGAGELETPACPGCQGPRDDRTCGTSYGRREYADDPYCERYKYHLSEFEDQDPDPPSPACQMLAVGFEEAA